MTKIDPSKQYVQRNGTPVHRFLCFDIQSPPYCVIYTVMDQDYEYSCSCDKYGRYYGESLESDTDLLEISDFAAQYPEHPVSVEFNKKNK